MLAEFCGNTVGDTDFGDAVVRYRSLKRSAMMAQLPSPSMITYWPLLIRLVATLVWRLTSRSVENACPEGRVRQLSNLQAGQFGNVVPVGFNIIA